MCCGWIGVSDRKSMSTPESSKFFTWTSRGTISFCLRWALLVSALALALLDSVFWFLSYRSDYWLAHHSRSGSTSIVWRIGAQNGLLIFYYAREQSLRSTGVPAGWVFPPTSAFSFDRREYLAEDGRTLEEVKASVPHSILLFFFLVLFSSGLILRRRIVRPLDCRGFAIVQGSETVR